MHNHNTQFPSHLFLSLPPKSPHLSSSAHRSVVVQTEGLKSPHLGTGNLDQSPARALGR
jgi:hypothetical protein